MNKSKRFFVCFFIAIFVMTTVTACGGNTSVAIPATEETVDQNAVDYQGEGQVQGGIKSDEEIAALQEEEQQYIDDSTTTEYESNEGYEPDTYIGAENFWQGEDYFDLENYLYMNGAAWVKKGYYDSSTGKFIESDTEVYYYRAQFNDTYWMVTIGPLVEFEYFGYKVNDEAWFGPYYTAFQSTPIENQRSITVNSVGTSYTDTMIETLDDMMKATKEYKDSENPFQIASKNGSIYFLDVTNSEIPAGAVHR